MLIQMRSPVAKVMTFGLFALLILSFAVWGIGDIFRGPGQSTAVAEVGGIKIEQRDFSTALNREMSRLQSQFGGRLDFEQARQFGVVDQVLRQMIDRALFDQQAAVMGLVVSEDNVKARLLAEPAFRGPLGDFDQNRFFQILQSSNMSEGQFLATLRRDILRQQIAGAVSASATPPATLSDALYGYANERRKAETITIATDALPEPADPDEATLASYYEENAGQFMAPETRSLTVVRLTPDDFTGEIAVAEDDLKAEFEASRSDFVVPERRDLEQVVLKDQDKAAVAKAMADDGVAFAEIARSTSASDPIALGRLSREDLEAQLPELADSVFAGAVGSAAGPVQSPFGWHLVYIKAIEEGEDPTFEEARERVEQDYRMRQAIDSMVSIANQLDDELAGGASLEEAADRLGITPIDVPAMDARGFDADGAAIEGLPALQDFLPVALDTAAGEDSLLSETSEGDYFILRVEGVTPAAQRPLEDVRDEVIARWKASQRDDAARARAEALAGRAGEGMRLASIAETEGLTFAETAPVTRLDRGTTPGASAELITKMFESKTSDIFTARTSTGYLVAKLTEITPADPGADGDGLDALRDNLGQSLRADILTLFTAALGEEVDISVNNQRIEELFTTAY